MHLLDGHDPALPEAHLGAHDGPHRHPHPGPARRRALRASEKLSSDRLGEPSADIRARVEAARELQRARFSAAANPGTRLVCNADMGPAEVRECCPLDPAGKSLLRAAMQQLHMSARAYHRILKLARTIADLAGEVQIQAPHVAEAVQYRPRRMV